MGRKNLASRPGIGIKPDLSADGIVLDGGFQKSSDVINAPSCSPSRIPLASDTFYHSTPTDVDVAASQSDLRNPSHASKHLS